METGETASGDTPKDNIFDWEAFRQDIQARGYVLCKKDCPGCAVALLNTAKDTFPGQDSDRPTVQLGSETVFFDRSGYCKYIIAVATRLTDGRLVHIKKVDTGAFNQELQNINLLLRSRLRVSPSNHCTPLLDFFQIDNATFAVLPVLSVVPPDTFQRVDDVIQFMGQVLVGLRFMHSQRITHRDCSFHNIQTDAASEYLRYLHEKQLNQAVTEGVKPKYHSLSATILASNSPPRYYINDLTFSTKADPSFTARSASGVWSRDLHLPEYYRNSGGYNPFPLDICLVGNMFRDEFLGKYTNLEFCRELVRLMTHYRPSLRPDAKECVQEWLTIVQGISLSVKTSRLRVRTVTEPEGPYVSFE